MSTIELTHCDDVIVREIEQGVKRKDIAQTYRLALQSSWPTDWKRANEAIIARWSRSGLEWIKKQAWSGKAFQ